MKLLIISNSKLTSCPKMNYKVWLLLAVVSMCADILACLGFEDLSVVNTSFLCLWGYLKVKCVSGCRMPKEWLINVFFRFSCFVCLLLIFIFAIEMDKYNTIQLLCLSVVNVCLLLPGVTLMKFSDFYVYTFNHIINKLYFIYYLFCTNSLSLFELYPKTVVWNISFVIVINL